MKSVRVVRLALVASALLSASLAWSQGGNPPASTKESGQTSGHGMTAVEQAQQQSPAATIKIGDLAPDFTLVDQNGQPHSLHDYKGKKNVALAFYVFAFGPSCTQEVRNFQQNLNKLEAADTQVLGVSMDSPFANKAFADQNGIAFPLLSDIGGKIIREYGIYKEYDKFNTKIPGSNRATYLIDTNGKVVEMQVGSEAVDPTKTVTACERRKVKG